MHSVTDNFFIAPQITTDTLSAAKAAGVTDVMMNRPDGEEPGMPTSDDIKTAAEALDLTFHYHPVVPGQVSLETIDAVASTLDGADGKVLGFCKTGARSLMLWSLAGVASGNLTPDAALDTAANVGFDFSGMKPLMDKLAADA